ncbi:hypothetical protein [Streptomyces sp. BSE6.1]|uniref:hypothetical protein n=1 Tax=Streptomyces sp. BSE6.1 TaxID=2605730 RepID=UPI001F2755DC|nr:hypothetical protein [Streptomyces sp. BSE6.1]
MSGTVGSISIAGSDSEFALLCDVTDDVSTPFLRRYATAASGAVTATDTALDGVTPYAVTGTVGVCTVPDAEPVDVTAHGVQDTGWALADEPGTVSVTLLVYAGTVTVTTGEGTLTVPAGASLSWSAKDEPGAVLSGTLTVDGTAPGASWHVLWTSRP